MVELQPSKLTNAGSIPVTRSMKRQARGSKPLAFFFGGQTLSPNGMRGKLGGN